jgi:hypothetical protein
MLAPLVPPLHPKPLKALVLLVLLLQLAASVKQWPVVLWVQLLMSLIVALAKKLLQPLAYPLQLVLPAWVA